MNKTHFVSLAFVAAALAVSGSALAEEASGSAELAPAAATAPAGKAPSFQLGLRLGYSIPMGLVMKSPFPGGEDMKLKDAVSSVIPLQLEGGAFVTPNVVLGAYAAYGFASVKDCSDGASCSAAQYRLGVQGQYHFAPTERLRPWGGLNLGYEWLTGSEEGGGVKASTSIRGLDLGLAAGFDYMVAETFGVGPFLSLSMARFSHMSTEVSGQGLSGNDSAQIPEKAWHQYLTIGVRGTFAQ